MSYRKKNIKAKIHKIKPKKSIFRRLWFWVSFLIIVVILVVCYFILFYSGFQVKNIVISGNSKVATKDLYNIVYADSNTKLVSFGSIKIVSRSIILVNKNKISSDLLGAFSDIEKLTIIKKLPNTLVLTVKEREPVGIFCPSLSLDALTQTDSGCFLIDNSGVIFEPLTTLPANNVIVRQIMSNDQTHAGQEVVSQNIISAIADIQRNLKDNFNINLIDALVSSPVRLNVITGENWKIYFDLSSGSDVGLQLNELGSLLNGGMPADSRKNLRYIDLRPKDRAIICDNSLCGG